MRRALPACMGSAAITVLLWGCGGGPKQSITITWDFDSGRGGLTMLVESDPAAIAHLRSLPPDVRARQNIASIADGTTSIAIACSGDLVTGGHDYHYDMSQLRGGAIQGDCHEYAESRLVTLV